MDTTILRQHLVLSVLTIKITAAKLMILFLINHQPNKRSSVSRYKIEQSRSGIDEEEI